MNSRETDDLIKKYLAAESTLKEEEKLFNSKNQRPGIEQWSTYVKQKRQKAPANLNASIWATIQAKKRKKQRHLVRLSGLAASIVIFMAFFIYNTVNKHSEYEEKEALLNEALSMFTEEKNTAEKQSILYEDDMVIIYLASK